MPKETRYLPQMKLLVTVLVVFSFQTTANARKFTRCEFAKELAKYGVPRNLVPDFVCLAEAESSLDTKTKHRNTDGTTDYGIFQINDKYWCDVENGCDMACEDLLSDDIRLSLACANIIYSAAVKEKKRTPFIKWYGWLKKCENQDLTEYVTDPKTKKICY